jgi:hypothetical protein
MIVTMVVRAQEHWYVPAATSAVAVPVRVKVVAA